MGAQPWQAPAKAQATVSRHKLQTRTNTVGATLLSFDDLVPGLAGAPPTARRGLYRRRVPHRPAPGVRQTQIRE